MPPFRRVHADDKCLSAEPIRRLMAWCPTMDLLAFVQGEGVISVHRLSWAKLLSFEESSPVTALAWSPDGKTIASGHDDGSLHLIDAETGEAISSTKAHTSRVTTLCWAANTVRSKWISHASTPVEELVSDRASSLLMPYDEHEEPGSTTKSSVGTDKKRPTSDVTILLSGDASGVISAQMLGTLCLGKVQVVAPGGMSASIAHLAITPDLSSIAAVVCHSGEGTSKRVPDVRCVQVIGPAAESGGHLCIFKAVLLSQSSPLLVQIASQAWQLECIFNALDACLESLKKLWNEVQAHTNARLEALDKCLVDHDSPGTAEGELLASVATGCASAPLQSFLSHLKEQGVRRWEKTVDVGCTALQTQVATVLLPAAQALVFRAGQLQGMSRWQERYAAVGLEEDAIAELVAVGGLVITKGHKLVAAAHKLRVGVGHFCKWLQQVAVRLAIESGSTTIGPEAAIRVSNFIKDDLSTDAISAFLEGIPAPVAQPAAPATLTFFFDPKPSGHSPPPRESTVLSAPVEPPKGPLSQAHMLLKMLSDDSNAPLPDLPLPVLLDRVRVIAAKALDGPRATISQHLVLSTSMPAFAGGTPGGQHPPAALWSMARDGEGDQGFTLTTGTDTGLVRAVNVSPLLGGGGHSTARALLTAGAPGKVKDMAFYSPSGLCVAVGAGEGGGGKEEEDELCLALLPLEGVEWEESSASEVAGEWAIDVQAPEGSQVRSLDASGPVRLAANGKRGVACCMLGTPWRMTLLDMEDEDEDGEEEEGEGGGEGEGEADVTADVEMAEDGEEDMEQEDIE